MEISLQTMCMEVTCNLLVSGHWKKTTFNPFDFLSSSIVNALLECTLNFDKRITIKTIRLLLISGKLSEVTIINGVYIKLADFLEFLSIVADFADQLQILRIRTSYPFFEVEANDYETLGNTFGRLLWRSQNLKILETNIVFHLSCLQNIHGLKHLELDFEPRNRLLEMIPSVNGMYQPNQTMRYFSIKPSMPPKISVEELVLILQYWPELRHLIYDIGGCLENCHARELVEGKLVKQYKLEKIQLGGHYPTSVVTINIAIVTCPNVKGLIVYLDANDTVAAIENFKNLEFLSIRWNSLFKAGNFRMGVNGLLEKIGSGLTHLEIHNFCFVDLTHIASFCPNLRKMQILYESMIISDNIPCFVHLESLCLEGKQSSTLSEHTLFQLLNACHNISYLQLKNIWCFDYDFVVERLPLCRLHRLDTAEFYNCRLNDLSFCHLKEVLPSTTLIQSRYGLQKRWITTAPQPWWVPPARARRPKWFTISRRRR